MGILQIDGKKIRGRLEPFIKDCLESIRKYLVELM
jgi:hypothetical protein